MLGSGDLGVWDLGISRDLRIWGSGNLGIPGSEGLRTSESRDLAISGTRDLGSGSGISGSLYLAI